MSTAPSTPTSPAAPTSPAEPADKRYDAVVVGSGPNGFAAAITLARDGKKVLLIEARDVIGGGTRSAELTLPGFTHDVCSAIHPMAAASPFFRSLPLGEHGLKLIHPQVPLAHPLDRGRAVIVARSVEETARPLGFDAVEYRDLVNSFVTRADDLMGDLLAPLKLPRHPLLMARFGLKAMRSASGLANAKFQNDLAKALFAGCAAHSILPLDQKVSAAIGIMMLVTAHAVGWPIAERGSQSIAGALASYFLTLGGEIVVSKPVATMADLPPARAYLFDVAPHHLARIAKSHLPEKFVASLERYRYGPGVFKLDWALSRSIPWTNPECLQAGTVHVGGSLEEIATSERAAWSDEPATKPFVLVGQQSLFDSTRAPAGKHTGWAYCHVPSGCDYDMTFRIEQQIERFAPGFGDTVMARKATTPKEFEAGNPNYIGGDITGGVQDLWQLFTRPTVRASPYTTPNESIYICSASTPPGGGVHGMCGFWAAKAALKRAFKGGKS